MLFLGLNEYDLFSYWGFPGGPDSKEPVSNEGDLGLIPGLERSPGEGKGHPFLPGESHGQRSLVGFSPWSRRESDPTD